MINDYLVYNMEKKK
jgi:hypothetical protein